MRSSPLELQQHENNPVYLRTDEQLDDLSNFGAECHFEKRNTEDEAIKWKPVHERHEQVFETEKLSD